MQSVIVAADNHYYRDANGDVYVDAVFNYDFYKRYLSVFDTVYAIGRVTSVKEPPQGKRRADGPGVIFLDLKPGRGLQGFLNSAFENKRLIRDYLKLSDCVIARIPGVVANMVVAECEKEQKDYSVEVVVDPWEYFSPEARGGIVNWAVRRKWTADLKRACHEAIGASYVTEHYLQMRYPCLAHEGVAGTFTSHYSSVELPDDSFSAPRTYLPKDTYEIVHAANTFQGNSKGHYVLFDAIKEVLRRSRSVKLVCIGDGPSLPDYIEYVSRIGIADNVEFTGRLADGVEVRKRMASADLFVFPTKAEGLPRVLLEAMAEGMPCLSTPVCGIPEVLPDRWLFDSNDSKGFADGIIELIDDPELMTQEGRANLEVSKRYSSSILNERRTAFYKKVMEHANGSVR